MKKTTALLCAILILGTALCSCGSTAQQGSSSTTGLYLNNIQNGILYESAGQADENGVYVVPDEVTVIAEGAFSNDTTIKKIVIGKNVKQIAEGAFYGCSDIEEIIIADGVEIIGGGAFVGCSSLKKIIIPNSVKELGPYAFYYCTALEEVKLSSGISEIYEYTFAKCPALQSVNIPEGVSKIGKAAFYDCTSLASVSLPSTLESLGEAAFASCSSISNFDLSATSVKEIDDSAFVSCSELKKIILPETLKSIGYQTFYECTKLYDINIPDSVEEIGAFALNLTPWYEEIDDDYKIVGDGVLIKCGVEADKIDLSGKGIKHISSAVFWNAGENSENGYKYAEELSSIAIPEGVISIGDYAFRGCSLDSISLPSTLVSIGNYAFEGVFEKGDAGVDFSALTSLENIGENAFADCTAITKVNLSSSVKTVGKYAFFKTVAMESFLEKARETSDTSDDFWISGDGVLLLCMVGSEQETVTVPEGVKVIGGGAMAGWDSTSIYDSNEGITDKYWYNAWNMDKVKEVVLPDTAERICQGAFLCAGSLEKVNIPDNVNYIGSEAFKYCSSLHEIQIGNGVKAIDDGAFSYSGLYTLTLELTNVENIGSEVFLGCKELVWVTFPVGLGSDSIGSDLFLNCSKFENIYISPKASARIYDIIGNDMYSSALRNSFSLNYYNE